MSVPDDGWYLNVDGTVDVVQIRPPSVPWNTGSSSTPMTTYIHTAYRMPWTENDGLMASPENRLVTILTSSSGRGWHVRAVQVEPASSLLNGINRGSTVMNVPDLVLLME